MDWTAFNIKRNNWGKNYKNVPPVRNKSTEEKMSKMELPRV